MVYEPSLKVISVFNWPSEASWKAAVIKYDFREGSEEFATPPGIIVCTAGSTEKTHGLIFANLADGLRILAK